MTLLIDGDGLAHAAGYASERGIIFSEYQHVLVTDERDAQEYIAAKLSLIHI